MDIKQKTVQDEKHAQTESLVAVLKEQYSKNFTAGLFVGIFLAGTFNPIDRALYLSVVKQRPFLLWKNFTKPFEGLSQALLQRTLSSGFYYPIYDAWLPLTKAVTPKAAGGVFPSLLAGLLTGATSGVSLNALSVIKYHNWSSPDYNKLGLFRKAQRMYNKGGLIFFTHGMAATIWRDAVFGATYSGTKQLMTAWKVRSEKKYKDQSYFVLGSASIGMIAGSLGTAVSSPFNFARNIQYASPPGKAQPSIAQSLTVLWQQAEQASSSGTSRVGRVIGALVYLQRRLRLGWGTLRVGLSMGIGQEMYDFILEKGYLDKLYDS